MEHIIILLLVYLLPVFLACVFCILTSIVIIFPPPMAPVQHTAFFPSLAGLGTTDVMGW